jgi:hypothetical protein
MMHARKIATTAAVLTCLCVSGHPAPSQVLPGSPTANPGASDLQIPPDLQNPNIEIAYVPPTTAAFQPIYERVRQRKVLEHLKSFLAPLRLSEKLQVNMAECGNQSDGHFRPGGSVTICYEYVAQIERFASGLPRNLQRKVGERTFTKDDAIAGAFVQKALHEVARAVFRIEKIPVWGREEFAADRTAGYVMLHFGDSIAYKSFIGASWFLSQTGVILTGVPGGDFIAVRGSDIETLQRFANTLCVAYGGNPKLFEFLKNSLPTQRAQRCRSEYLQLEHSFNDAIMPLIGRDLLKRVQAIEWF